jgi:hypothetical protein
MKAKQSFVNAHVVLILMFESGTPDLVARIALFPLFSIVEVRIRSLMELRHWKFDVGDSPVAKSSPTAKVEERHFLLPHPVETVFHCLIELARFLHVPRQQFRTYQLLESTEPRSGYRDFPERKKHCNGIRS